MVLLLTPLSLALACVPHLESVPGLAVQEWVSPDNSWGQTPPPAGLLGEGWFEGEVVPDVRGLDRYGDEVSLWQFYGQPIVLDVSHVWCGPCQALAGMLPGHEEDFPEAAFLTLLVQAYDGSPAQPADCGLWSDTYGLHSPVITDPDLASEPLVVTASYPQVTLIDPDLTVYMDRVESPLDRLDDTLEDWLR